ncbi:MAG: sugar ABC transporter permease [Propionibacteriaceae bacterium]
MSTSHKNSLPAQPKMPFGKWLAHVGWRHLVAIIALVIAIFPILYLLSSALNPAGTLTGSNKLFTAFSVENWTQLAHKYPFWTWFKNSLVIASVTAIGTVFLAALSAYAFSRMRFKGRRGGLMGLLLIQMFPQMLAFVAIFLLITGIGEIFPTLGLNSSLSLIMVYLGGALGGNTWLMYGFFNTVPASLDEAARVDGAGHARIFFTIILRLVAPILAVVGLLSFIGVYSDYILASMLLQSPESQTLAVGLYGMLGGTRNENWPMFAAGAFTAALPIMIIFQFLQKYIVGGLTAGAVK